MKIKFIIYRGCLAALHSKFFSSTPLQLQKNIGVVHVFGKKHGSSSRENGTRVSVSFYFSPPLSRNYQHRPTSQLQDTTPSRIGAGRPMACGGSSRRQGSAQHAAAAHPGQQQQRSLAHRAAAARPAAEQPTAPTRTWRERGVALQATAAQLGCVGARRRTSTCGESPPAIHSKRNFGSHSPSAIRKDALSPSGHQQRVDTAH